jgi:hypothetical protein
MTTNDPDSEALYRYAGGGPDATQQRADTAIIELA